MRKLWFLLAFVPFLFTSCDVLGDLLGDIKDEMEQEDGKYDDDDDYNDGELDDNVGEDPSISHRANVIVVEGVEGPLSPMATDFTIVVASDKPLDTEFFINQPNVVNAELTEMPDMASDEWQFAYSVKITFERSEYDNYIELRLGQDAYVVELLPMPNISSLPYHSVGVGGGVISEYHVFNLQEQYDNGYYGYTEVYWSETEGVTCPVRDEEYGFYSPLIIGFNPTTAEREIVICAGLRDPEGNIIKVAEYTVYQEGGVMMELPRTTYVAPNTTTQIEIPISSNVDFEVSVANWWVTVLEQTTSCLKINIEGYHGEASRKTTITLTNAANNFVQEIKVIQFPHAITTVHLDEEGTLAEKFTLDQMLNIEHLQITGKMDDRDFETLEKFTTLVTIDISGVQLPENMLPELAFDDMLVENIILPSTLTKIGRRAFADNPVLESVDIPSSVTEIDAGAFDNCPSLKNVKLPSGLKLLENGMFEGCSSLTEIDIPEGVEEIGSGAFCDCISLRRVSIPSSLQRFEFGTGTSYTYDHGYQFYGCKSLKEVSFPSAVNYIPTYCFAECDSLESVTLNNVETIRTAAFENCKSLKEVTMSRVTSIYNNAFRGCTALETVTCPIINNIGYSAFANCSALKEFTFPKTLKSIGSYVFSSCESLSRIEIPKSVTEIGDGAFQNCHGLISAYVYATILSLPESMFYGCDKLRYLELPEKLQTVEDNAFDYVHALLVLKLNSTSTTPLTGEGLDGLQRFRIDLLVDREVQTAYQNDEFWGSCRKINDPTTKTPEDASWDEYVKDRDFWDDFIQEN